MKGIPTLVRLVYLKTNLQHLLKPVGSTCNLKLLIITDRGSFCLAVSNPHLVPILAQWEHATFARFYFEMFQFIFIHRIVPSNLCNLWIFVRKTFSCDFFCARLKRHIYIFPVTTHALDVLSKVGFGESTGALIFKKFWSFQFFFEINE